MKKLAFSLLAGLLLLAACKSGPPPSGLTGTVNTDGSSSMADVMSALQEAFREKEPGVTVNYSGTGSGAGVEAALSGACDIGLSSRRLKSSEKSKGAVAYVVALDAVAVVVHPSNPVRDLTVEQLAEIFAGKISNWQALGGPDAPVAVYGREAGSGTRGAFEEAVGVVDRCVYTNVYGSTGDVIGNISANPNAIGYASLSSVRDGVAAVAVDGVACGEDTVRDGTYRLQRPFLMVASASRPLGEAAQAFLNFAQSEEAAAYITRAGAIAP